MWAGDAASGEMVAACDAGSQRTVPASSFSVFPAASAMCKGVKATSSEGAVEGFTGHGEAPTQTILSI